MMQGTFLCLVQEILLLDAKKRFAGKSTHCTQLFILDLLRAN